MNKKNIARIACVLGLAAWAGTLTYTKGSNRVLANAFPAKLLMSPGSCTTPLWPQEARRYEVEGITLLHFSIGEDGAIDNAEIARGSSWKLLDDAAMKSLIGCKFKAGLDEAERAVTFPIQFVWTLAGPSSVRPQLVAGSCALSGKFSGFEPLNREPTDKSGVLVRFLVNARGEPSAVKAEAYGVDAHLGEAAAHYVQSCRFAAEPALAGEQTDTLFGRVLVK